MRLGLGGNPSPQKVLGYGLLAAGGVVLLSALPLYFWAVAIGGFLVYLGLVVLRQR